MGTLFHLATGKLLQLNLFKEIVPATGQIIHKARASSSESKFSVEKVALQSTGDCSQL